ncbi:SDR family NAD(P)-dependent oxidoreductase [Chthonobacter rhizosphaerae]|uniref:SDR family NAD(P)-dependent oxidoreductase n=1 Tax=Chthonobacter rhizosphaerae TaxID=2735553 RepID=UPI0015EE4F3D|nr:SDR family NAD(P)-dependent oxidoreductase [Chthonobacter rhizosphaerae]
MTSRFSSVVLTGASSGIGEALALELAAPGRALLLVGRDAERLAAVADRCRRAGANVDTALVDVRDAEALAATLLAFDDRHPVDLLIANAGVSAGLAPGRGPEAPGVSRRLLDINYGGMLNTVEPLLPRLIARRGGRIALVSSLAGLRALPDMPSYSGTKAAVRGYGVALRGWLARYGVGVTLVYPGFVTSPMSARHGGARPFEISAEKAARLIVRRLEKGRRVIAFPFPLALGIFLGNLLPPALSDLTMKPFEADVAPDDGR